MTLGDSKFFHEVIFRMSVLSSCVVVIVANFLIIGQHANLNETLRVPENKILNTKLTTTTL